MDELFVFYALITLALILSWALILVIQYLFNVLKENKLYQKDAVRHSQEIISHANERAKQIISEAKIFSDEVRHSGDKLIAGLKESQKKGLQEAADKLLEEYKLQLGDIYKENINLFRTISKNIEERAESEIRDFEKILEEETVASQKIVGEKLENQYEQVSGEIEEYKNSQLAKVRENIYKIMEDAVKLAIGRSLDRQTHEDLVMEALRKAIESHELNQEA